MRFDTLGRSCELSDEERGGVANGKSIGGRDEGSGASAAVVSRGCRIDGMSG